jgi:hypothetical protein
VRHASPSKQKSRLAIRARNFANQRGLFFGRHDNRALRRRSRQPVCWSTLAEGSAIVRNVAVRHFRTLRAVRGVR